MPNSEEFRLTVFDFIRSVPRGRVVTYGQVARLAGYPRGARLVGWALHWAGEGEVPAQRVVNRFGSLASGYTWGGRARHRADLEAEGVEVRADYTVDLERYQWWPEELK